MANTYTSDDLKTIYRSLPENLQSIILSQETSEKYDALATKFSLTEEQRKTLSNQSGLLLMGVTQPQKFVSALINGLGVEREQALLIAQELNRDIFNSVKEILSEVHKQKEAGTPAVVVQSIPQGVMPMSSTVTPVQSTTIEQGAQPIPSVGSIFEQKLGGAFRMNTESSNSVGTP